MDRPATPAPDHTFVYVPSSASTSVAVAVWLYGVPTTPAGSAVTVTLEITALRKGRLPPTPTGYDGGDPSQHA